MIVLVWMLVGGFSLYFNLNDNYCARLLADYSCCKLWHYYIITFPYIALPLPVHTEPHCDINDTFYFATINYV